MKEVKALTRQIEATHASIKRVEADREAGVNTVESAPRYDVTLSELQSQRRTILAAAMVAKKVADTTQVDRDIAATQAQQSAAQDSAAVARDALNVYDEGLALARATLADLESQRRDAVKAQIMQAHDVAQSIYLKAVADMADAVAGMIGAENAWKTALQAAHSEKFPGRGKQVLDDVRTTGIRVPVEHSRLADPAIAAGYEGDLHAHWYLPSWADPQTLGLGDAEAARLIAEVQAAGLPCDDYVPTAQPVRPKMVKVRLLRGTMPVTVPESVKRSPETGAITSKQEHTFHVGDDFDLPEPDARGLARSGVVAIHGEGELPARREELPKPDRIEAIKTQADYNISFDRERKPSDRYHGNFHALDLTAYE